MPESWAVEVGDEAAMLQWGARLAQSVTAACQIHLRGELGTGKTTLVRGFMRALGYEDRVKSPTYTLIEPYTIGRVTVYHLDLYRLSDAEELDYLGFWDLLGRHALCLIEWPERAGARLPAPDLRVDIEYQGQGRTVRFSATTELGDSMLNSLKNQ